MNFNPLIIINCIRQTKSESKIYIVNFHISGELCECEEFAGDRIRNWSAASRRINGYKYKVETKSAV